jgi:hypothetical protein
LFEEAYDEYGKRVIENLEEALKAAREQKPQEVRLHFNLVKPEDHTEDYERVLYMLELEKNEEVILTQSEFAQLVQDDWGWRGQFNASYLSNTGKFAG